MNINDLLDVIAEKRTETGSDYGIAKYMTESHGKGWSRQRISSLRNGRDFPSDEKCMDIADATGLDPVYVMAVVHAEKSKNQRVKDAWRKAAASMAVVVLLIRAEPSHATDSAMGAENIKNNIHCVFMVVHCRPLQTVDPLGGRSPLYHVAFGGIPPI